MRPPLTVHCCRPDLPVAFVAPGTPVENALAGIWRRVLALESVGVHDDFLDLGGSSLQATQVASEIFREFHLEMPLAVFWGRTTIHALAMFIVESQMALLSEEELQLILGEAEGWSGEAGQ